MINTTALHRLTGFNFPSRGTLMPAETAAHCLCVVHVCLWLCGTTITIIKESVVVYLFIIAGQPLVVRL